MSLQALIEKMKKVRSEIRKESWTVESEGNRHYVHVPARRNDEGVFCTTTFFTNKKAEAEFIALSANEILKLCEAAEVMREELQTMQNSLEWYANIFNGPEHEFEHFWRVELPCHAETALAKADSICEVKP